MEDVSASRRSNDTWDRYLYRLLAVLALFGVFGIGVATRHGVGIGPDPVNYMRAARSLLAGEGLQVMQTFNFYGPVPMTSWPPGFPLMLAAAGSFGADVDVAARWINALLFGANIFLIGLIAGRYTRSTAAGLFAAFLMLATEDVVRLHMAAMSEPTFFFFGFLGIYLLDRYLSEQRMTLLLASAGAVGLAFLARYNGAGLVAACPLALLLLDAGSYRRRLRDAVLHGAISSLPMVIWLIRNHLVTEDKLYDTVTLTLPEWREVAEVLFATLTRFVWVFPTPGLQRIHPHAEQFLAGTAVVAFVGLVLALLLARPRASATPVMAGADAYRLPVILGLFSVGHVAVLYASISLFGPSSFAEVRQLFPAAIAVAILAICLICPLIRRRRSRFVVICLAVLVSTLSLGHLARGSAQIVWGYRYGVGFNSLSWSRSAMIDQARKVEPGTPLFSNYPHTVYFHTGHDVRPLPRPKGFQWKDTSGNPDDFGPNPNYLEEMNELRRQITDRSAVILFFYSRPLRLRYPSEEELKAQLPLKELARFEDGTVYAFRSGESISRRRLNRAEKSGSQG